MNAREFLRHYKYDERLVTGKYYKDEPVKVAAGDTVGVVLMNLGGPNTLEEIEPFLYNLFMDPAIIDMPFGGILRHWLSKYISTTRSKRVGKDYAKIGGGSPINKLTKEQAGQLEADLNRRFGKPANITYKVYIAMRYWHPTSEETAEKMRKDGVNKVVLLPLYPHYSKTTTGSSLVFWRMLEDMGEIHNWPTAYVFEYATHPKYIQAISERIDETLARFPADQLKDIQLLFSAHGVPLHEMKQRRDPYCCLIHCTVEEVMKMREYDYAFHVAFQSKVGRAEWLTPSTPDKLKELAGGGHTSVLIIPIAFVTDHVETLYELDMLIRGQAETYGIEKYEVMAGLNTHKLFIEALAEVTVAQVAMVSEGGHQQTPGPLQASRPSKSSERNTRCHQCEFITDAACWEASPVTVSTLSNV